MIKNLLIKLSKSVSDILSELPTNSVLRERISFINEQLDFLMDYVKTLETENSQIKKENADLKKQIKEQSIFFENFVEHRGALFKRKLGGGYHLAVYCPICHNSTTSVTGRAPYFCAKCNLFSDFKGHQIDSIMNELKNT